MNAYDYYSKTKCPGESPDMYIIAVYSRAAIPSVRYFTSQLMCASMHRETEYTADMTIPPVNEALIPKYTQQQITRYARTLQIYARALLVLCAAAFITSMVNLGQSSDSAASIASEISTGIPVLVGIVSGAVLVLRGRRLGRTILLIFGWLGALIAAVTSLMLPWVLFATSGQEDGAIIALYWAILAVGSLATLILLHNPRARIVLR